MNRLKSGVIGTLFVFLIAGFILAIVAPVPVVEKVNGNVQAPILRYWVALWQCYFSPTCNYTVTGAGKNLPELEKPEA